MVGRYSDAFKGTAKYYSKFRNDYPDDFFELIRQAFSLDGSGSLLDLGCGTGQIAIPLAGDFAEVIAMDPEPEMLEQARLAARKAGVANIDFVLGESKDLDARKDVLGVFKLVTMGSSFHWMDREATLAALAHMVEPGGGLAIASAGSLWTGDAAWCQEVKGIVKKWIGSERRAGSSTYHVAPIRHETFIDRSPFGPCEAHLLRFCRSWTVEGIIGNLYSTSFCSPLVLGDRRAGFETDLRRSLRNLNPEGVFTEDVTLEVLLGFMGM